MGILLSCQNLSKTFGARPLFEKLSFGLFEGERAGLIGPNGTGKSTLLKILAGEEKADEGVLSPRRGLKVGYLPQRDTLAQADPDLTVHRAATRALSDLGLEDWEVDIRVDGGLERAGFQDPDQKVASLSGGWRKRLSILIQVLREPELLLLDEPTNHLDLEGVLWLEAFLEELEFAFLVVTHDRRFLERVTNRVIELNKRYPEGYFSSPGNYTQFLEKREELFNSQSQRESTVANLVRREIEWLRRGPKARQTKQQARIDRAGDLMGELDDLKFRNAQGKNVDIDFTGSDRQTQRLVAASHIAKGFGGRKLFGPLDLLLTPGDKLGLLGENGSGKSTLLKILAGESQPDSGTLKQAEKLRVVTFDQHRDQLDMKQTLRQALCEKGDYVFYKERPIHVASWATRFLFDADQLDRPLSRFSGGEQSRVLIARLMLKPADLLLLDEPTNDLDIPSLEVLEQSLAEFPGALVLVTHDRYLLDRISHRILALDGHGRADYFADLAQWEAYREEQKNRPEPKAKEVPKPQPVPAAAAKKSLSSKEKKELDGMEAAVQGAEAVLAKAKAALEDPAIARDSGKLIDAQKNVEKEQAKVDSLYQRWDELNSKLDLVP
ncbi:MAG TPA: ABC-F family ATP-binding cassette domain-containing protein [bacterium]|nr:ABC-F family ATP-binding cassette domain-containing protein [bacterium]